MADFNRTANSAYYASRKELDIRGTREGSKTPKNVPTYRHVSSDANTSSNKYYAAAEGAVAPAKIKSKTPKRVELAYGKKPLVESIIEELADGATELVVNGSSADLKQAQIAVDLAVGRNVLTRDQADKVSYAAWPEKIEAISVPDVVVESVAAPVVEEAPAPVEVVETEEENKNITEADVAAAFGVDDDNDDSDA